MYPAERYPQQSAHIRLSVGARPAVRATVGVIFGFGVLLALSFIAATWLAGDLVQSLSDRLTDETSTPAAPGDPGAEIAAQSGWVVALVRGSGLCAVPIALFFGYALLRTLRYAGWLDGTTAVIRHALSTRRVDLSTAEVRGDTITHSQTHGSRRYVYSIAALAARDPATGTEVKIPLRGQGLKRLPPAELVALADAVMHRRDRGDHDYRTAEALANGMRQMAANSFPV